MAISSCVRYACVLVILATTSCSVRQDRDRANADFPTNVLAEFEGARVEGSVKSTAGEIIHTFVFNCLRDDVWRADLKYPHGVSGCLIRNGDFVMSSDDSQGDFKFNRVGFDSTIEESIQQTLFRNIPLLCARSWILGEPLSFYLNRPEVSVDELEPHGAQVTRTWSSPSDHGTFKTDSSADSRLVSWSFGFGSNLESPTVVTCTITYGEKFASVVTQVENGKSKIYSIDRTGMAEKDPLFYSPEALGLKMPTRPWPAYVYLLCIGAGMATLAVILELARRRISSTS